MTKITLTPVTNLSNGSAVGAINDNSDTITNAFENTLSRDGSTPNQMLADLDMNSNDILNVKDISVKTLAINNIPVIPAQAVNASNFATAAQGAKADTALQSGTSADNIVDGVVNKAYTATEKTKLSGVATGATANSSDAVLLARANHTGTESADVITDGTTNKAFLATERTKLAGVATSATANPVVSSTWTPVVTASSGTPGAIGTCTGTYTTRDGICFFQLQIGSITVGTAASSMLVTLPLTARNPMPAAAIVGREIAANAKTCVGSISQAATSMTVFIYDGTTPFTASAQYAISGSYFI